MKSHHKKSKYNIKKILNNGSFYLIAGILVSLIGILITSPLLMDRLLAYSATYTDNGDAGEFGAGTQSDVQWDSGNSWLELDATGLTNGVGTFTSRIIDATTNNTWTTFSWIPKRPTYKELPSSQSSSYLDAGAFDTSNQVIEADLEDTSGLITDNSGNGNDGTLTGASYGALGVYGSALSFDGVNDEVDFGDLDVLSGTAMTASLWINQSSLAISKNILTKWNTTNGTSNSILLRTGLSDSGEIVLFTAGNASDAGANYCETTNANIVAGRWYHLAAVYDGSGVGNTDKIKIYLNGTALSTTCGGTIPSDISDSDYNVTLGGTDSGKTPIAGKIDDFSVFSRALSAAEIANIAAGTADNNVESAYSTGNVDMTETVAAFHFNEASGDIKDDSGNNFNCAGTSLTYGATGKLNDAIDLNGSSSYADCTDQEEFSFTDNTADQPFSVCTWVNSDIDQTAMLASKMKTVSSTKYYEWQFGTLTDNKFQFYLYGDSTGTKYIGGSTATNTVVPNTWQHVCGTYNGNSLTSDFAFYINGEAVTFSAGSTSYTKMINTIAPLQIGHQDISTAPAFFNGKLDEMSIWDKKLSSTEVSDLYRRSANRLKFQVRSCDDAACDTEEFLGPDGTTGTFYTELVSNVIGLPSEGITGVSDNRYFQYQATLESDSQTLSPELVSVSIVDEAAIPIPGVTITESASTTNVTEGGATDTYTVVLDTLPTDSVVITPTCADAVNGCSTSPATLTFTTLNWNTPQTVTVTAIDDSSAEGADTDMISHAATSNDTDYNAIIINSVSVNITDNEPAAITIDCSANPTIELGVDFDTGDDLTLNSGGVGDTGGTCTLTVDQDESGADASVALNSLTLSESVVLTHAISDTTADHHNELHLVVTGDVTIGSGSSINVQGKGYLGAQTGANLTYYGRTAGNVSGSYYSWGGSHGGRGGKAISIGGSIAEDYDSITNPILPGGGGGGSTTKYRGTSGGGVVIISATNIVVDGDIIADAEAETIYIYGGGAGGTVNLTASGTLSGAGSITAIGSDGSSGYYFGAGGGGRIALKSLVSTFSGSTSANGGNSNGAEEDGAAGTIFIQDTDNDTNGHLTIDNTGATYPLYYTEVDSTIDQAFDSVTVSGYGQLLINSDASSYSTSELDVQANSYYDSDIATGETIATITIASGGTTDFVDDLTVTTLTDSGGTSTIGGDLSVTSFTLDGTMTITGALTIVTDFTFSTMNLTVGGVFTIPTTPTGTGTLTTNGTAYVSSGTVTLPNGLTWSVNGDLEKSTGVDLTAMTIQSGGVLTHDVAGADTDTYNQLNFTINGNLTVDAGGSIDVTGKGYLGAQQGANPYDYGRTIGNVGGSYYRHGGSHGGLGGKATTTAVSIAAAYDSIVNPILPGGGGGGDTTTYRGGAGGGVVIINANNIAVGGNILANGEIPGSLFYGSGAGGTVNLNVSGALSGSGTIAANGADASSGYGFGAGGGGRVSLTYASSTHNGTVSAYGGSHTQSTSYSGEDGSAGTVYKKDSDNSFGDLIINNNGLAYPYYNTGLLDTIPASDQLDGSGGYYFATVTVSNYGVLNIPSTVDSDGATNGGTPESFHCDSCTTDDDDVTNGEIVYDTALYSATVNANNYVCYAGNSAPTATTPSSITQAADGSGYITFSTTVSDQDSDNTKLKVEYSDDGGATWYDPDLVSVTPSAGTVDLDDVETFQIGSVNAIDTSSADITLSIVWDSKSSSNGNGAVTGSQSDIQIRVTANDNSSSGTASETTNQAVNNAAPTITAKTTADLDGDGYIDAINVTFSENIDDTYVTATDFDVSDVTGEAFSSTTNSDTEDDNDIYITFTDGVLASSATPTIAYTAGTLLDVYGNAMASADPSISTDASGPGILSAVAGDGSTPGAGIDDDDTITITFSEATNEPVINAGNIDTALALNNGHTWLDGAGAITSASWSSSSVLVITLSTGTSDPTVAIEDTITLDGTTITDGTSNSSTTAFSSISGSFLSNTAPTVSINSVSEKTDGTGAVDISLEIDDVDDDDTIAVKVEYKLGADCSSGTSDPTINTTDANSTATFGDPKVDNAATYQVGTSIGWITSSSGSNTVLFDWDSATDVPEANGSYCIKVTANDGTTDSTSAETTFTLDNVSPSITGRETADLDGDGYIDAIHLTFSENIDDTFVTAADFDVAGITGESFSSTTNSDTADDDDIYITFTDGTLTSASTAEISYTSGTLVDLYGNNLATSIATASTDSVGPAILSASASDGSNTIEGIDNDDTITITFSEATNEPEISAANIDTVLNLNNAHTWKDGDGTIRSAVWNSSSVLVITLSADTSAPTVAVGDTITLDGTSITDGTNNSTTATSPAIAGSFTTATVQFTNLTSTGAESVAAPNFEVSLSAATVGDVTVEYVLSGTAAGSGTDYTLAAGTATITNGNTTANITPTIVNDTLDEEDETIILTISNPTNSTLGGNTTHTYTITDDDDAPTVTLTVDNESMSESGGTSTITATLSAASGKIVTTSLGYSGTATDITDYTKAGSSIAITAGNTTGTIALTAVADSLDEEDETVIVSIDGVTNGTENDAQQQTVTIDDDDDPPSVTLGSNNSRISEKGGVAILTATLSTTSGKTITINLSFGGSATQSDYTPSGNSITIIAGNTTGTITITGRDNSIYSPSKNISTTIGSIENGTESTTQKVEVAIEEDEIGGSGATPSLLANLNKTNTPSSTPSTTSGSSSSSGGGGGGGGSSSSQTKETGKYEEKIIKEPKASETKSPTKTAIKELDSLADNVKKELTYEYSGTIDEKVSLQNPDSKAIMTIDKDTVLTIAKYKIIDAEGKTILEEAKNELKPFNGSLTAPELAGAEEKEKASKKLKGDGELISEVYKIGAEENSTKISLNKAVTIALPLDISEKEIDFKNFNYIVQSEGEKKLEYAHKCEIKKLDDQFFCEFSTKDLKTYTVVKAANPFDDISEHWAKDYIVELHDKEIVNGYTGGTHFKPNDDMNRAEFTKVALKIAGYQIPKSVLTTPFSDVHRFDWSAPYISTAYAKELIKGFPDGTFKPGNQITRAEALKVLLEASGLNLETKFVANFSDVDQSDWYAKYINYATKEGIVKGLSDGRFNPNGYITRAEVTKINSLILDRL